MERYDLTRADLGNLTLQHKSIILFTVDPGRVNITRKRQRRYLCEWNQGRGGDPE